MEYTCTYLYTFKCFPQDVIFYKPQKGIAYVYLQTHVFVGDDESKQHHRRKKAISHQFIGVLALQAAVVKTVLRTGRAVQVQDHVQTGVPWIRDGQDYKRKKREKKMKI